MDLASLGWNAFFEGHFRKHQDQGLYPARVVTTRGNGYLIVREGEMVNATLSGKFRHKACVKKDFPAVGDWVAYRRTEQDARCMIEAVLPRKSCFVRKLPISGGRKMSGGVIDGGLTEEQVIAANIDTAFIVMGLDQNFDLRRIERYLTLAHQSDAEPVIILSKADVCDDVARCVIDVKSIASGAAIHSTSTISDMGMDAFSRYMTLGKTVVFLGSSGVGKSSMINYLFGEEKRKTQSISSVTGKGRHTTTAAELMFHGSGCMMIDTPGLRELQLWGDEESLNHSFADIVELASQCRFQDCKHRTEPGCAIQNALEAGALARERFESYLRQLRELQRLSEKRAEFDRRMALKRKKPAGSK